MNQMFQEARFILVKKAVCLNLKKSTQHCISGTLMFAQKKYPGGPELIEKAKQIAQCLGRSNFKGSMGGWGNGKRDTILSDFLFVANQEM